MSNTKKLQLKIINNNMAHNEHYKHFPPEFEPYKICNNAFCSGNLQQIFQYVARRKHKDNELQDLKKALDFLQYEIERRHAFMEEMAKFGEGLFRKNLNQSMREEIEGRTFPLYIHTGVYILNTRLHKDFVDWCQENDPFLEIVYGYLAGNSLDSLAELIKKEILD